MDRKLTDNFNLIKQGIWAKGNFSEWMGLKGKTIGIIGLGNIGKLVASRWKAFEMKIIGFSKEIDNEVHQLGIELKKNVHEIAK